MGNVTERVTEAMRTIANTARQQTMASVVIGVALLTGRPGTASESPVSFLCRNDQADVSSKNPLRPAAQMTACPAASDMLLGRRASKVSLTSATAPVTVSRAWPTDSQPRPGPVWTSIST